MGTPDPFNRNTVKEPRLGRVIGNDPDTHDQKDAVHFAVVPLIAKGTLTPGQNIGITADEEHADPHGTHIGIVDPFLKKPVKIGERFWMVLYPGQVTTLRHEWTHPAFTKQQNNGVAAGDRSVSEAWLRSYAANLKPYDEPKQAYDIFLSELQRNEIYAHGTDLHSRGDLEDEDLLVYHAQIVLGRVLDLGHFSFSCSC